MAGDSFVSTWGLSTFEDLGDVLDGGGPIVSTWNLDTFEDRVHVQE